MGKINSYTVNSTPKLSDKLIGTSVGGTPENATYNFTLQQLKDLFGLPAGFTLTTTGSSGASTLVGTVLNVPNYTLSGLGGVPTSRELTINGTTYDLSENRTWDVGTVTSVSAISLGTSGTDLSSSVATGTTTPIITLNVPTASATNRGALSAADWITFNSKGPGTVTSVSALTIGTIGTDITSSIVNGTTTPVITLNIPTASATNRGALSATDWINFDGKQPAGNYISSLLGEATASGPGAASITLNNASVTGKLLTGLNVTGGSISATDTMLAGFGKLQNQINGLIGGVVYQGTWNASANTPTLTSGVGTSGHYYVVNTAGNVNLDGITDWQVGDWAIFDGTAWQQVDNTDAVTSVNGQVGAVSLTTDNISEGITNLYYLDSRARAALSFTAGSGAYNSTTGVITIPTNTNQLTNGASFITLGSLSGASPLSYNNTTGAFSIQVANTSQDGYLSSTDWNTFNSKGSGTLSSVGVSMPSAFSVASSPLTSDGTIAITGAGLVTQYIDGTGALQTFPTLTGYVPYTGASANVSLGEFGITAGYVGFDLTPTGTPTAVGTMYWDAAYRTVSLIDGDGDTTLQIGQEERILVHNNTGSTLTDGQVVYVTGSTGDLPSVSLADASSETTSAATLGVVTESILNGANGFITVSGIVNGLNTLAFTEGDLLWLSETAGQFTNVKPISPAHLVLIGYVIKRAGGNGSILVKIQNTQELSESSDVLISTPEIDGQGLFLETISGVQLWRNRSISDVLGYTPADGADYLALTGGTLTGGLVINPANPLVIGLDVASDTFTLRADSTNPFARQLTTTMGSGTLVKTQASGFGGTYVTDLGFYTSSSSAVNTTPNLYLTGGDNRVGVNTTAPAYTHDVVGTAGVSGVLTLGSTISDGTNNYTLPSATGTLALTSDIPAPVTSIMIAGAGTNSTIRCGVSNTASGSHSFSGGGKCNSASGAYSFIGGGGPRPFITSFVGNCASGPYSSIVGGKGSTASGTYSFIGGGQQNCAGGFFITSPTSYDIVVGGNSNTACGGSSAVVGGKVNTASGRYSFVGGGQNNSASGFYSFVGGGTCNSASGYRSFVGGGAGGSVTSVTRGNQACGAYTAVVGGFNNTAIANCSFIGGGYFNTTSGGYSAVLGGAYNTVCSDYSGAFGFGLTNTIACSFMANNFVQPNLNNAGAGGCAVCADANGMLVPYTAGGGGGGGPMVTGSGYCSIVGNGLGNTALCIFSTVSGGVSNTASAYHATVGGGISNTASGSYSGGYLQYLGAPTVGGGKNNTASACYSTVSGGLYNTASGFHSFVGGGRFNTASGPQSTISGGYCNQASGTNSFIGGGGYNYAAGTNGNQASGFLSTVAGGGSNTASGYVSSILAGYYNTVSDTRSVIIGSFLTSSASSTTYTNALSKQSGTFRINHPDPSKTATKYLQHSFVESPTRGDNIYRFTVCTTNCAASVVLPDYYKFLNEDDQVWVSPKNHFGNAYGIIDSTQSTVDITANTDGEYNVLVIGTRKDIDAKNGFLGVEIWK